MKPKIEDCSLDVGPLNLLLASGFVLILHCWSGFFLKFYHCI